MERRSQTDFKIPLLSNTWLPSLKKQSMKLSTLSKSKTNGPNSSEEAFLVHKLITNAL